MDMESSKYDTKVKGESKATLKKMPIIISRKTKLIQQDSAFQGGGTGGTSGHVDKGLRDMMLEDYPTRGRKNKRTRVERINGWRHFFVPWEIMYLILRNSSVIVFF